MVSYLLITSLALLAVGFGSALWVVIHMHRKRMASFKTAIEINQKKLDYQTGRLNAITRALPSLQALVSSSSGSDSWQMLGLDEARALIWADGASYWKYLSHEMEIVLQVARGVDEELKESKIDLELVKEDILVQAVKKRLPVLIVNEEDVFSTRSLLAVPLIVGGDIAGVFHFTRKGHDVLTSRDADLISMFMKQLGLAIENRNMVNNREKFYLELVQTLADILDSRDASNQGQTRRARAMARAIARELDMPEEFIYYLEFAALMHDIGKMAIDEQLLQKPDKLTPEEYEKIKKHPELGYKILAPVTMLSPAAPMVLYHQEWFNGKGYPEGLHGEEIPLGARIVAIIDAWGAMVSNRPWRRALTKEEAVREIKKGSGSQFDPKVVDAFIAAIEKQGFAIENAA